MVSDLGQRWRGLKVCNARNSVESLTHVCICLLCLLLVSGVFGQYICNTPVNVAYDSSHHSDFFVCVAGSQAFPTCVFSGK